MKFNCLKQYLVKALDVAIKATTAKPQTPHLACFYLEVNGSTLNIHANNYLLGIKTKIPVEVQSDGLTVVNAAKLLAVAKAMPTDTIRFEFCDRENLLDVMCGKTKVSLNTIEDPNNFPLVNDNAGETAFEINGNLFTKLITQTAFASATDDAQPIYKSCHIELDGDTINFVATNKHRLVANTAIINYNGNIKLDIPAEQLNAIAPYFDVEKNITLKSDGKTVSILTKDFLFKFRIIDGEFPNTWRKIIPDNNDIKVEVDTQNLLRTLNRAMLVASADFNKGVKIVTADDGLIIRAQAEDAGCFEEFVDATVEGGQTSPTLKINYLTDALKRVGEKTTLYLNPSRINPILVTAKDEIEFAYVVTPLRP